MRANRFYLKAGLGKTQEPPLHARRKECTKQFGDNFWWYECAKGLFFPVMQVFKKIVQILPVQPVFPYKRFCGRS